MKTEQKYCRVCDQQELKFIKSIHGEESGVEIPLYHCNKCFSFFTRTDFKNQYKTCFTDTSIDGHLTNENYVKNRVNGILEYSYKKKWIRNDGERFLDIGCGVGFSLVIAKKLGLNAYGIEPLNNAVLYARNTLGIDLVNSLFSADLFEENSFDFVMMDQVLEHVPNPQKTLNDAFKLLKPGGIFFLAVPPIDWSRILTSASFQLSSTFIKKVKKKEFLEKLFNFSRNYDMFCGPEGHINYFSLEAIEILSKNCNARLLEQYHKQESRTKYFSLLHLSTGSFFLRKY